MVLRLDVRWVLDWIQGGSFIGFKVILQVDAKVVFFVKRTRFFVSVLTHCNLFSAKRKEVSLVVQSEVQSRAEAELEKAAKSVLWEPPTTPARASGKPSQTLTVTVVPPPIDPPSSESGTRDVPPSDIPPSI